MFFGATASIPRCNVLYDPSHLRAWQQLDYPGTHRLYHERIRMFM